MGGVTAYVPAIITCEPGKSLNKIIQRYGVQVSDTGGRVRPALIPVEHLTDVASESRVLDVSFDHALSIPDPAPDAILGPAAAAPAGNPLGFDYAFKVAEFREKNNLGRAQKGPAVLIGVIDTGIDGGHPAFAGRVVRVLDQRAPSGHGHARSDSRFAGREYVGPEQTALATDPEGHGTAVASVAADLAPRADLVVVRAYFTEGGVANGLDYIRRVAEKERRPVVVNVSLNGHRDPHDGTDNLARAIEEFCSSGSGRVVCVSAGNEAGHDIHRGGRLPGGGSATLAVDVPAAPVVSHVHLNTWFNEASGIRFTITPPAGPAGWSVDIPVTSQGAFLTRVFGTDVVEIATRGRNPVGLGSGHHHVAIDIRPVSPAAQCRPGTWQIRITNQKKVARDYDAWVVSSDRHGVVHFAGQGSTDRLRIGAPGTAAHALTVAGYVSSNTWTDAAGGTQTRTEPVGLICQFSSPGPSRVNPAVNPDFAAPGAYVRAALSRQAPPPAAAFTLTGGYQIVRGTSFAAPALTGLVALLLQRDPSLNSREVEALLRGAAVLPTGAPSLQWGAGVVDATRLP